MTTRFFVVMGMPHSLNKVGTALKGLLLLRLADDFLACEKPKNRQATKPLAFCGLVLVAAAVPE